MLFNSRGRVNTLDYIYQDGAGTYAGQSGITRPATSDSREPPVQLRFKIQNGQTCSPACRRGRQCKSRGADVGLRPAGWFGRPALVLGVASSRE